MKAAQLTTPRAVWRKLARDFETAKVREEHGICSQLDKLLYARRISESLYEQLHYQLQTTFPLEGRLAWQAQTGEEATGWFWPRTRQGQTQRVVACELLAALAEEAK